MSAPAVPNHQKWDQEKNEGGRCSDLNQFANKINIMVKRVSQWKEFEDRKESFDASLTYSSGKSGKMGRVEDF